MTDNTDAPAPALQVEIRKGVDEFDPAVWDACAGPGHPFVTHRFLHAVEESGSANDDSGWAPRHFAVTAEDGRVLGVAPTYLKFHSYGEYVFDHGWAAAYERAGGRYYPKLQSAAPFTPVTGPRLLVRNDLGPDDPSPDHVKAGLLAAMAQTCDDAGLSSAHVTFPDGADFKACSAAGWLRRQGQQFHWRNEGYGNFDDFLAALSSRKRKTIRKEREKANAQGVRLHPLTGDAIKPEHWDAFYRFYLDTSDRKWGSAYLNRAFFTRIGETMADDVLLVMGEIDGRWVCGALNFIGEDALYGRNWGCLGDFAFLHFECCYYRAMDFAIERGIPTVEAGAQGPHKIQRGYMPTATYSAHYIPNAGFRAAVERFLDDERRVVAREMEALAEYAPFKRDAGEIAG
ncbi:MAG: GNAT family N-acetyltransferase [Pseudomonadota bacterium]